MEKRADAAEAKLAKVLEREIEMCETAKVNEVQEWLTKITDGSVTFDPVEEGYFCKMSRVLVDELSSLNGIAVEVSDFKRFVGRLMIAGNVVREMSVDVEKFISEKAFEMMKKDGFSEISPNVFMKITHNKDDDVYGALWSFKGNGAEV